MKKTRLRHALTISFVTASATLLAACTSSPTTRSAVDVTTKKRSKEYFAESLYGVKASPRVTNKRSRLPRGGGRDQIGKPYQIRGKWYYPKEQPGYVKTGTASWYGDAFHGRLTANGEIYDMTHLTAAHPTMPLPSYARVTNVANGASVIVRVNDRGPYERGRVIDLSHRAADMLGYAQDGTAKVKVEYVGRAPLEGQDDSYLLASYIPGNGAPDPSVGMPTGVMVAMNGGTPDGGMQAQPFPGDMTTGTTDAAFASGDVELGLPGVGLPENGPMVRPRPDRGIALASMSYGAAPSKGAAAAFDRLTADGQGGWKHGAAAADEYVMVGAFRSKAEAQRLQSALSRFGRAAIETSTGDDHRAWYSLTLRQSGGHTLDEALKATWAAGAPDAMTVRD